MSAGVTILKFTGNETQEAPVNGENPHIHVSGDFGGGNMALRQIVDGVIVPVMEAGVAVSFPTGIDETFDFKPGETIVFTTVGTTDPDITVQITVVPTKFPVV